MLPDSRTADIDGRPLAWREAGSGAPLVLVHGIGGSSESWAAQFAAFAPSRRVIAWDAPGYGASALLSDGEASAARYAALLGALLDHLGVAAADLVGHSIGAVIVAALNRQRPALARRVALIHPIDGGGRLDAAAQAALRAGRLKDVEAMGMAAFAESRGMAIVGKVAPPWAVADIVRIMAAIDLDAYRAMVEVVVGADIFADAPFLIVPTLVVSGADDMVAPEPLCRRIAAALPNAAFRLLPGVGHYLPIEDPSQFQAVVAPFLY
jgi:pimeloyl-ACP methyl ester carboxylesterase